MEKHEKLPVVQKYEVNLEIYPEDVPEFFIQYGGSIKVDCKMFLSNKTNKYLSSFPLILYRLLKVKEIIDQKGEAVAFTQNVQAFEDCSRLQANVVNVELADPISPQGITEMTARYHGPICGYQEVWPYVKDHVSKTYTLLRPEVLWYPTVAYPSMNFFITSLRNFNYVLWASVETGLIAVTGGVIKEQKQEGERASYTWQSEGPNWRLDVACAPFFKLVAGNATIYFLKESANGASQVHRALTRTFELCNRWFAMPVRKNLNIVEVPKGYGSQASSGLILLTSDSFEVDQKDKDKTYRNALSQVGHEIIHLWNVPSKETYISRWLDEGFSHYFEACLLREEFGEKAYIDRMENYRQSFLKGGELAINTPIVDAGKRMEVREAVSRGKGPWVLAVLRELVGEDAFLQIIREFLKTCSNGASLDDFVSTARRLCGDYLDKFFSDWFYGINSSKLLSKGMSIAEIAAKYR